MKEVQDGREGDRQAKIECSRLCVVKDAAHHTRHIHPNVQDRNRRKLRSCQRRCSDSDIPSC